MANPYFMLQQRIASLIAARPYFASLNAETQILTEQVADLEFAVFQVALPLGFGIVVTTADGKSREDDYGALLSDEDLNISIFHNPKTVPALNALDAQWEAIQAVHGQTVLAAPPVVLTERDYFRVIGHQKPIDAPDGCNCREIHLLAGLRLL